jgi:hypothetical protein
MGSANNAKQHTYHHAHSECDPDHYVDSDAYQYINSNQDTDHFSDTDQNGGQNSRSAQRADQNLYPTSSSRSVKNTNPAAPAN